MTKAITLALIFAAGATSMAVAAFATDQKTAQHPAKKVKPKKICKSNSGVTGSRVAKRVCKTQEEWQTAEKKERQEVGSKSKDRAGTN